MRGHAGGREEKREKMRRAQKEGGKRGGRGGGGETYNEGERSNSHRELALFPIQLLNKKNTVRPV